MTRSAYGPAWDEEANRRRLEITRRVTVASMAAQSTKDWSWLVCLHRDDPLKAARKAAFESAGVPVRFVTVTSKTMDRSLAGYELYKAPWARILGKRDDVLAMTRLDDDDALAPWALERIQRAVPRQLIRPTILNLPVGLRVWGGRVTVVTHMSNAWQTLVTPSGDDLHVYAYGHRDARRVGKLRQIDLRPGWVWARHSDTISGWHTAEKPITDRQKSAFPIDWDILLEPKPNGHGLPKGKQFR